MFFKNSQEAPVQETLVQVFSCEFCEISKNTFFTEHFWATAFVIYNKINHFIIADRVVNYNSGDSSLINDYFTYYLHREKDSHHH